MSFPKKLVLILLYSIASVSCADSGARYFPTGNEYVALPTIREKDGALEQVNVLHMGLNGLLAFSGGPKPFLTPRIAVNEKEISLEGHLTWDREADWLPRFRMKTGSFELEGMYFAPPGERGFVLSMKVKNISSSSLKCALNADLAWVDLLHSINVTKPLRGDRVLLQTWENMPVLEFRSPAPLVAFCPYLSDTSKSKFDLQKGSQSVNLANGQARAGEGESLGIQCQQSKEIKAGDTWECFFYFGLGPDEIGAFASAKEFERKEGKRVERSTVQWLNEKRLHMEDPALEPMMNLNAFFNRFYATGLTIDTEEVVCLTSRSPRYYVSGAYWDRDSLLWSFPSILMMDPAWAKKVLQYAFVHQARNFGVHSRYLSGAMLEAGFELDEFCAPIIALKSYVEATKDLSFLDRTEVKESLEKFESGLAEKKHPREWLYQTWLLPSDDFWTQRYVTYDNALVWRALLDLARIYQWEKDLRKAKALQAQAARVKAAILRHCVVQGPRGKQFAWSVDLEPNGKPQFYDEPPGSLLLLPHYGFCKTTDPVWKNTRDWIYSPDYPYSFAGKSFEEVGCAHAPHPWILAAANSLLAGERTRALKFLKDAKMDNGIACESVDENTGLSATGDAFATCAGFLSYGLWYELGKR